MECYRKTYYLDCHTQSSLLGCKSTSNINELKWGLKDEIYLP